LGAMRDASSTSSPNRCVHASTIINSWSGGTEERDRRVPLTDPKFGDITHTNLRKVLFDFGDPHYINEGGTAHDPGCCPGRIRADWNPAGSILNHTCGLYAAITLNADCSSYFVLYSLFHTLHNGVYTQRRERSLAPESTTEGGSMSLSGVLLQYDYRRP